MSQDDRRAHGTTADGGEIVRYDRAGKWYVEYPDGQPRRAVSVGSAALLATRPGAEVRRGVPGGGRFDALIKRMRVS